jgi:hypothetical protein
MYWAEMVYVTLDVVCDRCDCGRSGVHARSGTVSRQLFYTVVSEEQGREAVIDFR